MTWDCRIVGVQAPCGCATCQLFHNPEHDCFTAQVSSPSYPVRNCTAVFWYAGPLKSDMPARRYRVGERFRWTVDKDVEQLTFI